MACSDIFIVYNVLAVSADFLHHYIHIYICNIVCEAHRVDGR